MISELWRRKDLLLHSMKRQILSENTDNNNSSIHEQKPVFAGVTYLHCSNTKMQNSEKSIRCWTHKQTVPREFLLNLRWQKTDNMKCKGKKEQQNNQKYPRKQKTEYLLSNNITTELPLVIHTSDSLFYLLPLTLPQGDAQCGAVATQGMKPLRN